MFLKDFIRNSMIEIFTRKVSRHSSSSTRDSYFEKNKIRQHVVGNEVFGKSRFPLLRFVKNFIALQDSRSKVSAKVTESVALKTVVLRC